MHKQAVIIMMFYLYRSILLQQVHRETDARQREHTVTVDAKLVRIWQQP